MPESIAPRFKRPLILFVAVLLIALPIGILAGQGRGGGERVAVDPERGLVFSLIFFDHSAGDTRNFETPDGRKVTAGPQQPWTWQLVELFEIRKGQLHQIEAIMERSPYGMNSGWSSWEDGLSDRGRDVTKQ